tara:strand:- start:892 stop:1233 length:342 start_codon:yes stop_codon:yes gene_type:complete
MAKILITNPLFKKIKKKFDSSETNDIIDLMNSLENNPKKGKEVGVVGNIVIKEIKYNKFRFYFVTNRFKIKFLSVDELKYIFIKFVEMSEKKDQQKVIDKIKFVVRSLGEEGF